jgi:hypothetical protein
MILLISFWSVARPALPLDGPANRWMSVSVVAILKPELLKLELRIQDRAVSAEILWHLEGCEQNQMRLDSDQISIKATRARSFL